MARLNQPVRVPPVYTHEGATASRINYEQQLRRSVMSCLLWETEFYEDGESIAKRIAELIPKVSPASVCAMAITAREEMKLRHIPLFIVREMARHEKYKPFVAETLSIIIQRPDELMEFLAIYWKDGKCPIANCVKKGLARAFTKFNEYQLAKYNRDGAIKLRDVMFLCHVKPSETIYRWTKEERRTANLKTKYGKRRNLNQQELLLKRVAESELKTPDTWEVALSAGADKKATFERLIGEGKLGGLALLRNLRNMQQAGVNEGVIAFGLKTMKTERILPFRFIAAARYAPQLEPLLETKMFECLNGTLKLPGKTILMIDVSGSMDAVVSGKSEMTRLEAACALAMLAREICDNVRVVTFSTAVVEVPPRRGFALRDIVVGSQPHGGTYLGKAVEHVLDEPFDRLIVISDEQSHDRVPSPKGRKAYMVNVASNANGVGYGEWKRVDGWSESIISYIRACEGLSPDSLGDGSSND